MSAYVRDRDVHFIDIAFFFFLCYVVVQPVNEGRGRVRTWGEEYVCYVCMYVEGKINGDTE